MHRREHLHVATRVQAELGRDPVGHHVHGQFGGGFGLVHREQEEVGQSLGDRELAGVDPVRVGDHPGLLRLPEDVGQPHVRDRAAGDQQITQHLTGADRRQLVRVTDQQQVRARTRPP